MKSKLAGFLCSAAVLSAGADTLVTTIPLYDYNNQGFPWGSVPSGATPNYGQTFTTPLADPVLTSMSFIVKNNTGPIPFHAYIYAWNGSALTGPAKFTSSLLTVNPDAWFQTITIPIGNVNLTPGGSYMALLSTIGDGGGSSYCSFGLVPDAYPGGNWQFNSSTSFPALFSPGWIGTASDLAFSLQFVSVPEPGVCSLLSVGFVAMIALRRAHRWFRAAVS